MRQGSIQKGSLKKQLLANICPLSYSQATMKPSLHLQTPLEKRESDQNEGIPKISSYFVASVKNQAIRSNKRITHQSLAHHSFKGKKELSLSFVRAGNYSKGSYQKSIFCNVATKSTLDATIIEEDEDAGDVKKEQRHTNKLLNRLRKLAAIKNGNTKPPHPSQQRNNAEIYTRQQQIKNASCQAPPCEIQKQSFDSEHSQPEDFKENRSEARIHLSNYQSSLIKGLPLYGANQMKIQGGRNASYLSNTLQVEATFSRCNSQPNKMTLPGKRINNSVLAENSPPNNNHKNNFHLAPSNRSLSTIRTSGALTKKGKANQKHTDSGAQSRYSVLQLSKQFLGGKRKPKNQLEPIMTNSNRPYASNIISQQTPSKKIQINAVKNSDDNPSSYTLRSPHGNLPYMMLSISHQTSKKNPFGSKDMNYGKLQVITSNTISNHMLTQHEELLPKINKISENSGGLKRKCRPNAKQNQSMVTCGERGRMLKDNEAKITYGNISAHRNILSKLGKNKTVNQDLKNNDSTENAMEWLNNQQKVRKEETIRLIPKLSTITFLQQKFALSECSLLGDIDPELEMFSFLI